MYRCVTIPQSKIKDFCQPPLHKGAFYRPLFLPISQRCAMIKEKAVKNMAIDPHNQIIKHNEGGDHPAFLFQKYVKHA